MPSATDDPLPRSRLLRGLTHHRDNLVPALGWHQLEAELGFADAVEMAMAFDEPGNHQRAGEVDHLRVGTDVLLDLGVGADKLDLVAANGDRLPFGLRGVDRDDAAVAEDEA